MRRIAVVTDLGAAESREPLDHESAGPAVRERITYGFLPASMRFASRPTFQHVVSFKGHRPR